jgi:hypothetical protein
LYTQNHTKEMKEYIFDRETVLKEISYDYEFSVNDNKKWVYKVDESVTQEELKSIEKLGDGLRAQIYVLYLNWKHGLAR